MLENVEFKQKEDMLCIFWTWTGEMENMEIRFKGSGLPEGEGALFSSILRLPGIRTGSVRRRITSEWGLYDFSFFACLRDGSRECVGLYTGVMIGEKRTVFWKIERRWGGAVLRFPVNGFAVPAGVVCISYRQQNREFRYVLCSEVNDRTRLEFPDVVILDHFEVFAREPYDKAYSFRRL